MLKLTMAAAAVVALSVGAAGVADAKRAAKCVNAGGQGTGLEMETAKMMAKESLHQALANHKWKGKGKISYKCTGGPVMPTCTARQRACK